VRYSWVHPQIAERIRAALRDGRASWEDVFAGEMVRAGEPPDGVADGEWPRLAEHVARAERVREVVHTAGVAAAEERFGDSPHAVERAALLAEGGKGSDGADVDEVLGILTCAIDEWIAYGQFLSRLVQVGVAQDPAGTVAAFEQFVAAAEVLPSNQPSWPERVRVARDGLAALYVRVGRRDDAEALYARRFAEEPDDVTVAISAARAFLEAGAVAQAVTWLGRGSQRAATLGRDDLRQRLESKAVALRARMN
jgi:hypothetical protein